MKATAAKRINSPRQDWRQTSFRPKTLVDQLIRLLCLSQIPYASAIRHCEPFAIVSADFAQTRRKSLGSRHFIGDEPVQLYCWFCNAIRRWMKLAGACWAPVRCLYSRLHVLHGGPLRVPYCMPELFSDSVAHLFCLPLPQKVCAGSELRVMFLSDDSVPILSWNPPRISTPTAFSRQLPKDCFNGCCVRFYNWTHWISWRT